MSVKVNIHPFLGEYTNNQDAVEVNGSTVGECLEQLVAQFPGIREALFGKDGNLLNCIDIFVNADNAYPEELAKPVKDGDKLYIVMIMGCVG